MAVSLVNLVFLNQSIGKTEIDPIVALNEKLWDH